MSKERDNQAAGIYEDSLLSAQKSYFIGRFIISMDQISSHPDQRLISEEWVQHLSNSFEEEIDRAANPIKVVLEKDDDWESLAKTSNRTGITHLSHNAKVLVFDGQHRVEACRQLPNNSERWWYGDVYRAAFNRERPAEFLSFMHLGNEAKKQRMASDAERFLALYKLCQLKWDDKVDSQEFKSHRARLMGIDAHTRRGLSNLTRNKELASTIAKAIRHPQLQPIFNAGRWRSLTQGRCYRLISYLIQEMEAQCLLLRGEDTTVSSEPFELVAKSCTWSRLESNIKTNQKHAWHQLDGGAAAALARVRNKPATFSHWLGNTRKEGTDQWMFKDMVLLPSVMTSATVLDPLGKLYILIQHVVHMVAGRGVVEKYTSNHVDDDNDIHPAAIFAKVLGMHIVKPGEKPNTYPEKIIFAMWHEHESLTKEIISIDTKPPLKWDSQGYQKLINSSFVWWTLIRMFKKRHLHGLDVEVQKEFQGQGNVAAIVPEPVNPLPCPQFNVSGLNGAVATPGNDGQDLMESASREAPSNALSKSGGGKAITKKFKKRVGLPPVEAQQEGSSRKRKGRSIVGDVPHQVDAHSSLHEQLEKLEKVTDELEAEEAGMVSSLLDGLLQLKGSDLLVKVLNDLNGHLKRSVGEAVKQSDTTYEDERDGDEDFNPST